MCNQSVPNSLRFLLCYYAFTHVMCLIVITAKVSTQQGFLLFLLHLAFTKHIIYKFILYFVFKRLIGRNLHNKCSYYNGQNGRKILLCKKGRTIRKHSKKESDSILSWEAKD